MAAWAEPDGIGMTGIAWIDDMIVVAAAITALLVILRASWRGFRLTRKATEAFEQITGNETEPSLRARLTSLDALQTSFGVLSQDVSQIRTAQQEQRDRAIEEQAIRNAEARLLRHEMRGTAANVTILAEDVRRTRVEWHEALAEQGITIPSPRGPVLTAMDPDIADTAPPAA